MSEEIEVEVLTLADGKDYYVILETEYKDKKYVYLVEENNDENVCIRRIDIVDKQEIVSPLDSDEELEAVLKEFQKQLIEE